jgi:preprotein translocase subunit SecD
MRLISVALISLFIALPARAKRPTIELRLVAQSGGVAFKTSDRETVQLEPPLVALPADAFDAKAVGSAVEVVLSPSVAKAFEAATGKNVGRRLAIVVDGIVQGTPIIRDAITGGRVSVTVQAPEKAQALARRLNGAP